MKGGRSVEFTVGVFVVLGALFLGVMIFTSGSFRFWTSEYELKIGFADVAGLKQEAPVLVAGTQKGVVTSVEYHEARTSEEHDTYYVTVRVSLPVGTRLPKGTRAFISSQGFLGEIFVGLEPGREPGTIEPGSFLRGREMTSFADVQQTAEETLHTVNDVVGSFRGFTDLATDRGFGEDLRTTVENARAITEEVRLLVSENRPGITRALDTLEENLERGSTDFRLMAADWRESSTRLLTEIDAMKVRVDYLLGTGGDSLLQGAEEFRAASRSLRAAGGDFEAVASSARRITDKGETDLVVMIARAREISEELRGATRHARSILASVDSGSGAAGVLLRDTAAERDMRALLHNLEAASARLEEVLADVKRDPERYLGNLNMRFSVFGGSGREGGAAGSERRRRGNSY